MNSSPIFDQIIVGYAPLIDRQRGGAGMRLTVVPRQARTVPDAKGLLQAVLQAFPAPSTVLLNLADEGLLDAMLAEKLESHVVLEVPAFLAEDPARADQLRKLRTQGVGLAYSGRAAAEIPPALQSCFRYSVCELDHALPAGVNAASAPRAVTQAISGVTSVPELERAFTQGAAVAIGWPVDSTETLPVKGAVAPELRGIMELMQRVDRQEPAEKMEPVLKMDPTLAFRLLRYINSPAFGLRVEVTSFKHALMLLGYGRLKRWLSLLLASGSRDPAMRPLMRAAVYRGFLMEELGRSTNDTDIRGEMFVCGVFSLLDQMLRQPFKDLLASVPVPDRVATSLLQPDGPFSGYLSLVRALELASPVDIREHAEKLFITPGDVTRAVFAALGGARQVE